MPDLRIHYRSQLVTLARKLGVRSDWHEPDNQGVTARVEGTDLDNAMPPGTWLGTDAAGVPHAELYVILSQEAPPEGAMAYPGPPEPVALINLATLLAWACGYDERGERCTCTTVSANGDPEAGDVELDVDCPTHGSEASYATLGRRYEALMARLREVIESPSEPFSTGYDILDQFAVDSARVALALAEVQIPAVK